jgi:diacylglycerol kinase family enzyme
LAINGGDGTINRTLTAVVNAYGSEPLPKIALLRGGTMNVLATNLGIRGSSPRILYRLCEAYSSEQEAFATKTISSLKVEDSYGFLFADGIAYTVLDEFYKNKTGPLGAAWLVLRLGLSTLIKGLLFERLMKSERKSIATDGVPYELHQDKETCSIMAASIERMPFGFRLFPFARRKLKQMQWFSVTCEPRSVLWHLPQILLQNRTMLLPFKISGVCERLSITAPQGYTYSLDGELFTSKSTTLTIEPGPNFEFIVI